MEGKCHKRLWKEDDFSDMANMSPVIHPVAEPPIVAIPTVMKYKIPKETECVKPNLVGDLIFSPQDHNTAKILSEVTNLNGKTIKILPLDPEEKTTRMVLLRYPLELPVEVVIKHPKVTKAERCVTSRDKAQTRQVLMDIKGTVPEEVDLGNWGTYKLRPSVPEPLRCYKCQKFGHHQSRCHKNVRCGICSQSHMTEMCIQKHKDGTITTAKCPNCGKKHHAWSTSCPERLRADESCNGKSSTTKQNRSTSEHIRVGSTATEYRQPNTHSAPTVRGFLPCTFSTRLQDKIEDTRTKSVHAENHDKPVDSSTAAPELCSSKRTEHSSIGGEHHIAWDTATPSGDHPTEYTPACQSTSGIHRRTNKTDDHYDNAETRYQHRKYNKCSYDTAHRKDAGRPDPQNSTTTSGTDDALETDIRQEEELAIQEITQNRETSSPLQQITRNRTINTDRQQTYDHRQERQHPEERRKKSRDSTSCSSLRAGAQETATTPNGRGGERLDHERREQLQHQRRGDNDRIAPPPCNLKITPWNVQGLSNKRHTVQAAALAKNIDVFILQESLMSKDQQFRLPGYQQYSVPKGPNSHGSMILVRATIPSSEVEPVHCGDGVEAQAVRIHLANDDLVVYNIYKPPTKRLEAGELLTQATQELVLIAGDFNAHHPTINSTTRMNLDDRHLVELLRDVPEITLINTGETTHILGGTLDLTFISTELVPVAHWEIDDELTTTLRMELLPPPPRPPPRWNTKKTNWKLYQDELQKWEDKWLEWWPTFNAHTSLSEIWRKLRIARGKLPKSPAHPQPLQEANRLAEHFAERSSSAQLPPEIRLHLQQVQLEREVVVRHAIEQADTTDCLDVFNKKTWLLCAADAVNRLKLKDTILSKGPDTMSPEYSTPAPWESPQAVFNILQTGTRKA
ncbi:RNA-directed DNA polymerase from mobile element jockey-like 9, partial [Homarus americanus]